MCEKIRHDLDKVVVLVLVNLGLPAYTPIHEDIPFPAVAMHVAEQNNLVFLVISIHEFFRIINSGMKNF